MVGPVVSVSKKVGEVRRTAVSSEERVSVPNKNKRLSAETYDPSLKEIRREYPLRTSWGCKVLAAPAQAPPAAAHAPPAAPGQAPPAASHATSAYTAPDVNGSFAIGVEDVKRSCAFNLEDVRGFDENPPDIPVIP
jgi:hypothetical protein